MSKTRKMALTGMLCALSTALMMMGGLIPLATFACPMLAALALIPILVECGQKMAFGAYIAISALSLILCPDKEAALLFAFIGHYPLIRWRLDQFRSPIVHIVLKLGVFNLCILAMYALILWVLHMEQIVAEYRAMGALMTGLTLLLGNVCLLLYDRMVVLFTGAYVNKLRNKLLK